MTDKNPIGAFKLIAVAALAAALLGGTLLTLGGAAAWFAWSKSHPAPLKDLSDGTLPKTFMTRNPGLQAKLKELDARKLLPNQYPPADFEAASRRLWESYEETLSGEPFAKLLAGVSGFKDVQSGEPRYSRLPDATSSPEQVEDFLHFVRFVMQERGELEAFKDDASIKKALDFAGSVSKVATPCRRPADIECECGDVFDIFKIKLQTALAEGRRALSIRLLDAMFKLSRSPLAEGLEGEELRMETADCAVAALKTDGWSAKELQAVLRIVERETAEPFRHERILNQERLETLRFFEEERDPDNAMNILRDVKGYYEDYGILFPLGQAIDLADALSGDIDKEELRELELIDAMAKKGRIADSKAFRKSLGRTAPLSKAEGKLLKSYCRNRSRSDDELAALAAALKATLAEAGGGVCKLPAGCKKAADGFEAVIDPENPCGKCKGSAFVPFVAGPVEKQARKL